MKSMIRKMGRQAVSVVNFEGMNRVPPPAKLREAKGEIVPGMENVWYEYVPACYRQDKPLPLVVQLHVHLGHHVGQQVLHIARHNRGVHFIGMPQRIGAEALVADTQSQFFFPYRRDFG